MFNEIIIHKSNLINNIKQVKFENPNSKVCAMVKANAYGVGDKEVVQILEDYVDFWGVACFFEAQKIKTFTNKPILIVGAFEKENIDANFSYSCGNIDDLKFLISTKLPIKIHLKVNSGMNRYGFKDLKEFKKALNLISHSSLIVEGIFTHFATTDEYVEEQMKIFNKFVKVCNNFGFYPLVHADNSFVNEKFNHGLDMVRIGFSLYNRSDGWFLPAVEIKGHIVETYEIKKGELVGYGYKFVAKRNMKIATIPIGYADGFDTKYVGLDLIIDKVKCKVLNVCMDCFMLDISKTNLKKGDEIYILNKFNSLKHYSDYLETTEYEIMTKFSHMRTKRIIV